MQRVAARSLVVGVVGLGYVGLPFAVAHAGVRVHRRRLRHRRRTHRCAEHGPEPRRGHRRRASRRAGLGRAVRRVGRSVGARPGRCRVHLRADALDRHQTPDLSYVRAALTSVAASLRPGKLVILQSTTYPGTTTGGLRAGARSRPGCGRASTSTSPSRPSVSTPATQSGPWRTRRRSSAGSRQSAAGVPHSCSSR